MNSFLTEELIHKKSSQELTSLLYEACIVNLEEAVLAIQAKKLDRANTLLQKSNDILYRLGAGLNYEAGIIADQLEALYDYMANRLIEANWKKDISLIEEVLRMLKEIAAAWHEACQNKESSPHYDLKLKSEAYEKNMLYDKNTE